MTDKKNKDPLGGRQICPRCKGRGKIVRLRDEGDVCGYEQTCPVCGGRTKIKPTGRASMRPRRSRRSHIPSKPKPGGGGRRRPPCALLLPPGTPVEPWPEGDGIPTSTPESLCRRPGQPELVTPEAPEIPAPCDETVLDIGDDITFTLGPEFGPGFALDVDASGTKGQELLESDDGRISTQVEFPEDSEALLDRVFQRGHLTGDLALADVDDAHDLDSPNGRTVSGRESVPPDQGAGSSMEPPNPPIAGLPSQPSAGGLDAAQVVDTDVIGSRDPIDPQIDYGPIGFDINTDVIGPEPF